MSDQGWNNPGSSPQDPQGGWGTPPSDGGQGQAPPPPQEGGWTAPPPQPGAGAPPPPQQGGWGQPPATQGGQQPQWGQQPPQQPGGGSGGIDPKIAGILAYVPFGWLGGLVIYLVNKDPLSRFHGAQSILLGIATFALWIGATILGFILPDILGLLLWLLLLVIWLGFFGLSIYLAIQGYNLKKVTLPVVGPIAEQWATK